MSTGKVVVLGINGHIGKAVAEAFATAGWDVTGMGRSDKHRLAGVKFVAGDSDSVADMRRAIGDAEIVVNALNMRYDQWFDGRLEAQMRRVLEALGTSGRTLLFPGNIYNYAADSDRLTPDLPQHPPTPRGAIRVRVEQMFREAAERGDIQAIILRAGDFFGPGAGGDWFDQIIMREAKAGKASVIGTPGVGHSWAYLPDLGRGFEALASLRSSLGPFETFHFAGSHVTPEEMGAAIGKASPGLKISVFPFWMLRLFGMVDPVVREVARMRYIWQHPLQLTDARLDELLGPDFGTPFDEAVAATVAPFLTGNQLPVAKAA
ncbi:MAG TPA: NAD-dependent epimerase/dehydratase family protein [Devosia sp.]|nr:NAD-dependent epimerase/dehydratase family protein [Devosia sp.]